MTGTNATRADVGRERLAQAVEVLVSGDQWRAWLETRAKFHDYSLGNTMLIAFQRPDATQVAGYRKWQELGRQVRKSEKGIAILAPIVRRVKDDETGEYQDARDDAGRRVVRFKTVYVFDVSQTEGDELPSVPCRRLDSDSGLMDAADALTGHAMAEGLDVVRESIPGETNGFIARGERRIVIDAGLSPDQSLKVLLHELAHWHDLGPDTALYNRPDAEIVAESVAYIGAHSIGLDTSDYSAAYIAVWANGDPKRLHEFAERIDKAARPILAALSEDTTSLAA